MSRETIKELKEEIKELNQEKEIETDGIVSKKATSASFILMFPALILAGMAVFYAPVYGSLLAIALAIYQFLMIKKFIETYYSTRQ